MSIGSQLGPILAKSWTDFLIIGLFVGLLSDGSWERAIGIASLALLCLLVGNNIGMRFTKSAIEQSIEQMTKPKHDGTAQTVMHDVATLSPGQAMIYRCTRIHMENGMRSSVEFIAMDADDFDHILSLANLKRGDVVKEKDNG